MAPTSETDKLARLVGKRVSVFVTHNNVALHGVLKEYDDKNLVLDEETVIERNHVISVSLSSTARRGAK